MIHLTKALIRRWLDALLHIDDTPERTAAAFALGVFFGFSPFLGFHTVLGIVFAFLLNLNRVAVLLGVYSNLPWVIAPYYAFATMAGAIELSNPNRFPRRPSIEQFAGANTPKRLWHQFGSKFEADHSFASALRVVPHPRPPSY